MFTLNVQFDSSIAMTGSGLVESVAMLDEPASSVASSKKRAQFVGRRDFSGFDRRYISIWSIRRYVDTSLVDVILVHLTRVPAI